MIGRVTSPAGAIATLHEDGTWTASIPGAPAAASDLMEITLAAAYPPQGPQDGDGAWPLRDLARRWGVAAEIEPKTPAPAGTIY